MAKFTKRSQADILAEVFPTPLAPVQPPTEIASIRETRCGGCAFFLAKLDTNNPFDGFCHALPPENTVTGFKWTKTASNEIGCGLFKKRG